MDKNEIGKFIALILRHRPDAIGITLDEHGWANVEELIEGISRNCDFNMAMLEDIVKSDNKQRYSFNDDKTLIRANQGHSIAVDIDLQPCKPPDILYHGTAEKYEAAIDVSGLIPKSRLYVHPSADKATAEIVGKRHGVPVVYSIDSKEMYADGLVFFCSVNKVWLTKHVPVKYLHKL